MTRYFVGKCRIGILVVFIFNTVLLIEHLVVLSQEKPTPHQLNDISKSRDTHDTVHGLDSGRQSIQVIQKDIISHDLPAKVIYDNDPKMQKKLLGFHNVNPIKNKIEKNIKAFKQDMPSDSLLKQYLATRTNVTFLKVNNQSKNATRANKTSAVPSPEELIHLQRNFYQIRDHLVNPFPYKYIIKPKIGCSGDNFIAAFVHSKPDYHDRRDAIRRTWGSLSVPDYRWGNEKFDRKLALIFVIGQSKISKLNDYIEMESYYNGDILVGDFQDSYKNMTLKSLFGLKYAREYCKHVPHLLKSDDDMFINIPLLTQFLDNSTLERSIVGPYNDNSKVYRKGKWNISYKDFPFEVFPPYESGSAYVITMDIVPALFETSHYVPWMFIDDVYITGILGKILNVTHVQTPGRLFAYWNDKKPDYCDLVLDKKIAMTKSTPKLMDTLWSYVIHGKLFVDICKEKVIQDEQLQKKKAEEKLVRMKAVQFQKAKKES